MGPVLDSPAPERPLTKAEQRAANRAAHRQHTDKRSTHAERKALQTLDDARLALLAAGAGSYVKIYRSWPLPPTFQGRIYQLETVRHLDGITDLAEHVRQIGLGLNWDSGTFEIHGWVDGEKEPRWQHEVAFEFPKSPVAVSPPQASALDQMRPAIQLAAELKALTGGDTKPEALAATYAGMFTSGMAAGKGPDLLGPILTAFMPIVAQFAARLAQPIAAPSADDLLNRTLGTLRSFGLAGESKAADDPIQALEGQVTVISRIAEAVSRLAPAASGPAVPSMGAEFMRALPTVMPMLGQAIGSIMGGVNQYLEVRRLEALTKLGATVVPGGAPAPAALSPKPPEGPPSPLAPFRRAIVEGIHTDAVFGQLRTALLAAGGGSVLEAMAGGQVTFEGLVTQLGNQLPELRLPGSQPFVQAFMVWLQRGSTPVTMPTNGATVAHGSVAVCGRCQAEYDVPAEADLTEARCDAGDAGAVCGGPLMRRG